MFELPVELSTGLAAAAHGRREADLGAATTALIERYQADRPATVAAPILGSALATTAYLLYRMPATYAAVRAALDQIPDASSGGTTEPRSQLDLGGGTGAALWAAADRWPGLREQTVLDNAAEALAAGRRLASASSSPALRAADWRRWSADSDLAGSSADLVTVSYVLSELTEPERAALITTAARAATRLLVVVEPGTRSGYRRILAARDQLLADGWSILAPCPHAHGCPMVSAQPPGEAGAAGEDWCHFASRVNRSALHRRLKGAEKSYEDEKFSYLVVSRTPLEPASNRILRHPRQAKGRVELTLCSTPPQLRREVVTKRDAEAYRAARRAEWGDPWPPPPV